jgi:hypothetical protein
MNSVVAPLAGRPARSALSAHQKAIGALDLRKLFVDDPAPADDLRWRCRASPRAGRAGSERSCLPAQRR